MKFRRKRAHFPVVGPARAFNTRGHGLPRACVTIAGNIFMVRPHRRRKVYALPLNYVADLVVENVIRAEVRERRRRAA